MVEDSAWQHASLVSHLVLTRVTRKVRNAWTSCYRQGHSQLPALPKLSHHRHCPVLGHQLEPSAHYLSTNCKVKSCTKEMRSAPAYYHSWNSAFLSPFLCFPSMLGLCSHTAAFYIKHWVCTFKTVLEKDLFTAQHCLMQNYERFTLLLCILGKILLLLLRERCQGFQVVQPKSLAVSPYNSAICHPVNPRLLKAVNCIVTEPKLSLLKYMHGFHGPDFSLIQRKTLWCSFLLPCWHNIGFILFLGRLAEMNIALLTLR